MSHRKNNVGEFISQPWKVSYKATHRLDLFVNNSDFAFPLEVNFKKHNEKLDQIYAQVGLIQL